MYKVFERVYVYFCTLLDRVMIRRRAPAFRKLELSQSELYLKNRRSDSMIESYRERRSWLPMSHFPKKHYFIDDTKKVRYVINSGTVARGGNIVMFFMIPMKYTKQKYDLKPETGSMITLNTFRWVKRNQKRKKITNWGMDVSVISMNTFVHSNGGSIKCIIEDITAL